MQSARAVHEAIPSPDILKHNEPSTILILAAAASVIWIASVILVCTFGHFFIQRYYARPQPRAPINADSASAPHVTIIRPLKGLEPRLYDCLACTFRQDYPRDKMHIRFCVSDPNDVCIPIVKQILDRFQAFDAKLLVETEDELLNNGQVRLGPNPKIRNVSRAYREAIGDIIWAIDCNIWVAKGALGRMVSKLEGHGEKYRWKVVHHLPIVEDIVGSATAGERQALLSAGVNADVQIRTSNSASAAIQTSSRRTTWSMGGGRLEEQYLSSMHPKFYVAAYMLGVPAVVGKSVMYRRSHLNSLTDNAGIDYFSEKICEDQLIGILMFKNKVPEECQGERLGRQAICWGDIAVQPMANMSVVEYWSRRVRWFRVRKFTEFIPSLVESGTECFFCSLYIAFVCTTLPFFHKTLRIPRTWAAFALIWLLSVSIWCVMDWQIYKTLHSASSTDADDDTPDFVKSRSRSFAEWLPQWLGREGLAFPIWLWAFYGGSTVEWRGQRFRVGMDSKVHVIGGQSEDKNELTQATFLNGKNRQD